MKIHLGEFIWYAACDNVAKEDSMSEDLKEVTCQSCLLVRLTHVTKTANIIAARLKELSNGDSSGG